MPYGDQIFGLRQIKITPIPIGAGQVDLPAVLTLKFAERLVTGELKGSDSLLAVVSFPEGVEWTIDAGGISLPAWAALTGRTATESGTTPSRTNTLSGKSADVYPYFKIYGKALGQTSDDIHVKLWKCKVTKAINGEFKNGAFWMTGVTGIAIDDGVNGIWTAVQNETSAALPAT